MFCGFVKMILKKGAKRMKRITEADKLIELLEAAGFEAYYVGGCVRDLLRGKPGADIDVTTSAMPDEMKEVFADLKYFETGIKHGTLTVLTPDEARRPIEITTFRTDGVYTDNRHPDEVRFVRNLEEDLERKISINELSAYLEMSEEQIRSVLRLAGGSLM